MTCSEAQKILAEGWYLGRPVKPGDPIIEAARNRLAEAEVEAEHARRVCRVADALSRR